MAAKLRRLVELLEHELSVRRLEQEVASQTQQRMTKQQREHLLREQLRSIQSELEEEGEGGSETAELRKRVEETPLSPEARREAERELGRLEQIPAISPEFGIARSYLDWLLALPWGRRPEAPSTSPGRGQSSTRITTTWKRSRSGSSIT